MSELDHSNSVLLKESNKSEGNATCSECGTDEPWGLSSWCPRCGFYPKLGKCVGQSELQQEAETKPQPQTIWELIPEWGWILAIGTIASIGLSVGGLFYCSSAAELSLWTLTQATVGLILFMVGQVIVYLKAVSKSADFGMMSIFLTPLKIWGPTIRCFPKGAWKLDLAVWGLTLLVGAFAIVGGFEFNSLFKDWGVRKSASVNLVATIVDHAKEADGEGGAENLEDALNDFAGGSEEEKEKAKEKAKEMAAAKSKEAEPKLVEFDCLLLGYTTYSNGKIDSILLAASHNKQLVYAGTIDSDMIPEEVLKVWQTQLPGLKQSTPFVKMTRSAIWLKPKVTLKVASKGWRKSNQRLVKPEFVSLLQEISLD